jgi:acyl-CoA reductase-like NAD-dependent aldehyde dehydrogenase
VNAWNGPDVHVSQALADERVRMLNFTGSDRVGWMLKEMVPDRKVLLELGGDARAIVEPDADLEWAVQRIVSGGYGYAGQVCISVQHVLVHESIYMDARERLTAATWACPFGNPSDEKTVCGPLISEAAAEKVAAMVSGALKAGATSLAGGERSGTLHPPTLLENVPDTAALASEEVFGPVMTLRSYGSLSEVIENVNRSKYGIQAGLFTHDLRTVDTFYRQVEVGGLIVNDYPTLRFDNFPYGGVKRSGFGREGVRYAMDEMTEPKTLLVKVR